MPVCRSPVQQLEMELYVGDELKQILTGKLNLPELCNDDLDESRYPSGGSCTCEQAAWRGYFDAAAKASWGPMKGVLTALVEQAKQKWA